MFPWLGYKRLWLLPCKDRLSFCHFLSLFLALSACMLWWSQTLWWRGTRDKEARMASAQHPEKSWDPWSDICEELNPANNHWVSLGVHTAPAKPWVDDCSSSCHLDFLKDALKAKDPAMWYLDSLPLETEIINVYSFNLLNLGIIFISLFFNWCF